MCRRPPAKIHTRAFFDPGSLGRSFREITHRGFSGSCSERNVEQDWRQERIRDKTVRRRMENIVRLKRTVSSTDESLSFFVSFRRKTFDDINKRWAKPLSVFRCISDSQQQLCRLHNRKIITKYLRYSWKRGYRYCSERNSGIARYELLGCICIVETMIMNCA